MHIFFYINAKMFLSQIILLMSRKSCHLEGLGYKTKNSKFPITSGGHDCTES